MTSFIRLQTRIADQTLPPYRRLSHLRSCLIHFAPYGLRSTYGAGRRDPGWVG